MKVKNKRILKQIAKEWCKGILLACEGDAFDAAIDEGLINEEEASYIALIATEIGEKITNAPYCPDLTEIIRDKFKYE